MPEHDESKGYWETRIVIKESAKGTLGKVIDGKLKRAYFDSGYEEVTEWHQYTPEELAQRAEAEKREEQQKADREFLDEAPERLTDLEWGVDDSYDAIAELGGAVGEVEVTLDDVMDAIAELGQIVEG